MGDVRRVAMFCCNVLAEFEWPQANASKLSTYKKPLCLLVLLTPVEVSEHELKVSARIRNPMLYPTELQAQLPARSCRRVAGGIIIDAPWRYKLKISSRRWPPPHAITTNSSSAWRKRPTSFSKAC